MTLRLDDFCYLIPESHSSDEFIKYSFRQIADFMITELNAHRITFQGCRRDVKVLNGLYVPICSRVNNRMVINRAVFLINLNDSFRERALTIIHESYHYFFDKKSIEFCHELFSNVSHIPKDTVEDALKYLVPRAYEENPFAKKISLVLACALDDMQNLNRILAAEPRPLDYIFYQDDSLGSGTKTTGSAKNQMCERMLLLNE